MQFLRRKFLMFTENILKSQKFDCPKLLTVGWRCGGSLHNAKLKPKGSCARPNGATYCGAFTWAFVCVTDNLSSSATNVN